jgi:hypothetical protein
MKRCDRLLNWMGLFCAVTFLYSAPVRAEDASAAETAAARSLAVEGLKLAQAGDCAGALPKLERAEKLYHAAVVASRLGECYVSVGRLVEGTEVLRKLLREPQPAEVTPALSKALDRAQHVLDAAKPRIAGLTVKVTAVQDMSVKLDGVVVPSALADTEIPTDPGEHSIEVSAPGFLKSSTHVKVAEAEKKSVTLTLSRDPNAAVAAAPPTEPVAHQPSSTAPISSTPEPDRGGGPSAPPPPPVRANHTAAYVSLGVGAAGVVTGGVLGLLTLSQHKTLQGQCPNDVCPPDKQADLRSAKQLGNFSTVAFGIGGAGLVLGTVLLFTGGSSASDHAQQLPSSRFAGIASARLGVGPGQVVLDGDF